jgi:hypothetical protein
MLATTTCTALSGLVHHIIVSIKDRPLLRLHSVGFLRILSSHHGQERPSTLTLLLFLFGPIPRLILRCFIILYLFVSHRDTLVEHLLIDCDDLLHRLVAIALLLACVVNDHPLFLGQSARATARGLLIGLS